MLTKVCKKSDIPKNGVKAFEINGKNIFIANIGNEYFCNDNTCTHRKASLHEGDFDGKIITCPWHGAKFDVTTGKNLTQPAPTPLKHYRLKLKEDEIWIDL